MQQYFWLLKFNFLFLIFYNGLEIIGTILIFSQGIPYIRLCHLYSSYSVFWLLFVCLVTYSHFFRMDKYCVRVFKAPWRQGTDNPEKSWKTITAEKLEGYKNGKGCVTPGAWICHSTKERPEFTEREGSKAMDRWGSLREHATANATLTRMAKEAKGKQTNKQTNLLQEKEC